MRIVPELDAPQCQCQRPKSSNPSLQCSVDAHKTALTGPAEDSDSSRIADAKDPSGQSPACALVGDSESERDQALEVRLDFLRESCRVIYAQKNDLLSQKDGLLAQQSVDLATLKTQLAATHQIKNDLLVEKDTTYRFILADKNEELAALKAQLAAVQQSIATITTDRDEAHARVATIADALEKTHVEYGEKVFALKTRTIDVERNFATLQATI